jgi:cytochrome oxidase Cu insertion factor (SCO1/SenC/PrrC family)
MRRWPTILLVASCTAASLAQAQRTGPKDGADLAPTDTARVAIGMAAPDFTLEAFVGAPVTLSEFRGRQNVILVFFRGHW